MDNAYLAIFGGQTQGFSGLARFIIEYGIVACAIVLGAFGWVFWSRDKKVSYIAFGISLFFLLGYAYRITFVPELLVVRGEIRGLSGNWEIRVQEQSMERAWSRTTNHETESSKNLQFVYLRSRDRPVNCILVTINTPGNVSVGNTQVFELRENAGGQIFGKINVILNLRVVAGVPSLLVSGAQQGILMAPLRVADEPCLAAPERNGAAWIPISAAQAQSRSNQVFDRIVVRRQMGSSDILERSEAIRTVVAESLRDAASRERVLNFLRSVETDAQATDLDRVAVAEAIVAIEQRSGQPIPGSRIVVPVLPSPNSIILSPIPPPGSMGLDPRATAGVPLDIRGASGSNRY